MNFTEDIHQQFAEYFDEQAIWPYAYMLSHKLTEGNICIPVDEVKANLGSSPYDSVIPSSDLAKYKKFVTLHTAGAAPFVLHNDRLYFQRYFKYETSIIEKLKRLIAAEANVVSDRITQLESQVDLIKTLTTNYDINGLTVKEQVDWQLVAVLQALLNQFTIITGGPGTGKTTTLAKLLIVLYTLLQKSLIIMYTLLKKLLIILYT
jgi:exodeoxyribonuclease V alpha subunit